MIPLDPIDCRILYELDCNARTPFARIGKKLRISADSVLYRVSKLEQSGVIERYAPQVDLSKMGLTLFRTSIKCAQLEDISNKAQTILTPQGFRLAEVRGNHDLIFWGAAKSVHEIQIAADNLQLKLGDTFRTSTTELITEMTAYSRGYLINKPGQIYPVRGESKAVDVDQIDLRILDELNKNARSPVTEIAKRLKTTPAIVTYRIEKLEKSGIIHGYRLHLNSEAVGIQRFRVQLELLQPWAKCGKAFTQFCASSTQVMRLERMIGSWTVELGLDVESFAAVHRVLDELKKILPSAVRVLGVDMFRRSFSSKHSPWAQLL